jgi:hypothetical protein
MAPKISTAAPLKAGDRFGEYTVIHELENVPGEKRYVLCRCDCGRTNTVQKYHLIAGTCHSCHTRVKRFRGRVNQRLANILSCMRQRCYNPRNPAYSDYGGRGITMCEEWRIGYAEFCDWALANGYDDTLTIDRIDNDGDYSPNNCRWVPLSVNARRRRNTNVVDQAGLVDNGE